MEPRQQVTALMDTGLGEANRAAAISSDMDQPIAGMALRGIDASKVGLRAAII
jgi:hypothetical protein